MGAKIGASFTAYIYAMVQKALANVVANAASYGVSGYQANGFSDSNWLTMARNVKLANGNADVYAIGTNVALGKILPDATNFRFGPESSIVTKGMLPEYKNVPMIEMGNALTPKSVNSTPTALIADDFVLMVAMGSHKPIKVAIEGDNVVVQADPLHTADHTFGFTVDMYLGADVVVGSKFGYMKLQ